MARRVTVEDIKQINLEYLDCHSYAETARRTGWSASTVKAHIDPSFKFVSEDEIKRFDLKTEMPQFSTAMFEGLDNYGELCVLSDDEKAEIKELWKEMLV